MNVVYTILLLLSMFTSELGIETWLMGNDYRFELMDVPAEKESEKESEEKSEKDAEKEFLVDIDTLICGDSNLWSTQYSSKRFSHSQPIIEIHSPPPDYWTLDSI